METIQTLIMKELPIEEKAKRYDEALENMRKFRNALNNHEETDLWVSRKDIVTDIEYYFPELKEPEDERIRKEILGLVQYTKGRRIGYEPRIHQDEMVAWLEKQGQVKKSVISQHEIETCKENSNSLTSEDEKIREVLIHIVKNACSKFGITYKYQGVEVGEEKLLAWLEKQGEQKPADKVEPKFKVKYAGSEYNVLEVKDIAGVTYYGIEDEPNHIDYVQAENCERVGGYSIKEKGSPYPTKPAVFSAQKPAWSEEDKKKLNRIFMLLAEAADEHAFSTTCRLIGDKECVELQDFLRSLKPQPKQERSEDIRG